MIFWQLFPWRVFFRIFLYQVVVYNLLFFIVISFLDISYTPSPYVYLEGLVLFFMGSVFLSAAVSTFFCIPLQKLLHKALIIFNSKNVEDEVALSREYLLNEDGEEFGDLENAFNRLLRRLVKVRSQMVRERDENHAIFSSVAEALVSTNLEDRVLFYNTRFQSLFIEPSLLEREVGFTLSEAIRIPEVLELFQRAKLESFTQKGSLKIHWSFEAAPRYFSLSVYPLKKGSSQEVYGVVGVFHDITELKRAEQMRIEFVDNASHELRTPLTSVKGYAEMLKNDLLQNNYEHSLRFLDIILRNTHRLVDLVNDLLTIRQIENVTELKRERIEPLVITEQVVSELAMMAQEKNHQIFIRGNAKPFKADARKVEQVLRNLVSNAIKYIPSSKQINIEWSQSASGDVILKVRDTGPGIAKEHLDKLFDRFYRIDKGRTRDAGGTGLGLAIVKHIMESHGGSVSVSSQLGEGTEFVCHFPKMESIES